MNASQSVVGSVHIRRIAVVGGGPTGVACARYLLAEKTFDTIDVFEQRANVGGIWNLSEPEASSRIDIPQTNPRYGVDNDSKEPTKSLEFESPLYDYLETNIPKSLMAYSNDPFDKSLPLFPGHADVLRYLEQYAAPVKHLIHLNTQVVDLCPHNSLSPRDDSLTRDWKLSTKQLKNGKMTQALYDAVIIANGHYTVPHVPAIPGLAQWHQNYPGSVIHSKAYRRPEDFRDKKVLVIGNSASGLDIAAQLASCTLTPVYLASRSASQLAPKGGGPTWRKDVAEIDEFLEGEFNRAVRTKTGEIVEGLDTVIFATGYFYTFPFLPDQRILSASGSHASSPSDSTSSVDSNEIAKEGSINVTGLSSSDMVSNRLSGFTTSGLRAHDVYKHFLHIDYPTLAFPVLNLKVIPFPLAENQAAVLARLWSGRLETPSTDSMRAWEEQEQDRLLKAHRLRPAPDTASGEVVASTQNNTASREPKYEGGFHTLVYPEDAKQINSLYEWASTARRRDDLENDGNGKLGTRWDEEKVWLRGQFPDIKSAYAKKGDDRTEVKSLDMLGEEWKHGFEHWKETTTHEEQQELFRKAGVLGW